VILLIW